MRHPRSTTRIKNRMSFLKKLATCWPPHHWQQVITVVGVSGGADSTALLRGMCELEAIERDAATTDSSKKQKAPTNIPINFIVAHFNHATRGQQSTDDELFVRQLCQRLQLKCVVGRAQPGELVAGGDGFEANARHLRHSFFVETAKANGARYVALAHTADDQIETVLHRILRGTGVRGLSGIAPIRLLNPELTLIHPMLQTWRNEVEDYLKAIGQDFRLDTSNLTMDYTRNRIRNSLLPQLKTEFNEKVDAALLRLGHQAGEHSEFVRSHVQTVFEKHVKSESNKWTIIELELLGQHPELIQRELLAMLWSKANWPLQEMSFSQWSSLQSVLVTSDSKRQFPGSILVENRGGKLILQPVD